MGIAVNAPNPFPVRCVEASVNIFFIGHQLVFLTGKRGIFGSVFPVFARQGGTGIDGISHIYVDGIVFFGIPVLSRCRVTGDGLVEIFINPGICFGQSGCGKIAFRLVYSQREAPACTIVAVLPAMRIELAQHQITVSAECKCLGFEKLFVGGRPCGVVHFTDNGVGIADDFVVIKPRVIVVNGCTYLVIFCIYYRRPPGEIAFLEVVARIIGIPRDDGTFAVESLGTQILGRHQSAQSVNGQFHVLCRLEDRLLVGVVRRGVQIVVTARIECEGSGGKPYID